MLIAPTAAASISTSQALGDLSGEERVGALALLVFLVGAFQLLFGFLRFGSLIRFVSFSVTTGFLSGVSVLLIVNQVPVVAGYESESGRFRILLEILRDPSVIHLPSLALALAVLLPRTPIGNFGRLVAVVVPSLAVVLMNLDTLETVHDVGKIPPRFPLPRLPPLSAINVDLITGTLAVVIMGAGCGRQPERVEPGRDTPQRLARLHRAEGANVASGLLRGLPVGGSHSATSLNVIYDARTRWAAIFAGLWMAAVVTMFSDLVGYIAMPALGALLIFAGFTSLPPQEIRLIRIRDGPCASPPAPRSSPRCSCRSRRRSGSGSCCRR